MLVRNHKENKELIKDLPLQQPAKGCHEVVDFIQLLAGNVFERERCAQYVDHQKI
jgi:hypothetical protein